MPVVPRYNQPQVQAAGLPGVRVSSNAPQEAFGGGQPLKETSNAIQNSINSTMDILQTEKKKADDLNFLQADLEASQAQTEIETNVKSMLGRDAAGAGEYADSEWKSRSEKIRQSLVNDDQRAAYDRAVMVRYSNLNKVVQSHSSEQFSKYENELTKSYIENARNEAVLNYNDPERVALALYQQEAALEKTFDKNGINPNDDIAKKIRAEEISKTHASIIERMLSNGEDMDAEEYFKANKDQIQDSEIVSNIEKSLEDGSLKGKAQRNADQITMSAPGMVEALKETRKIQDVRERDETESRVKNFYALQKAAEEERQDNVYKEIGNLADSVNSIDELQRNPGWRDLSISEKNAAEKRVMDRLSGANTQTDRDTYNALAKMASSNGEQFLKTNLNSPEYKYKLSESDYKKFVDMQSDARKGNTDKLDGFMTDNQIVDSILFQAGFDTGAKSPDSKKRAERVKNGVDKAIALAAKEKGRALTGDEVRQIAKQQTIEVVTKINWFNNDEKVIGELDPDDPVVIPEQERASIEAALKDMGYPQTEKNIKELYLEGLKSGR